MREAGPAQCRTVQIRRGLFDGLERWRKRVPRAVAAHAGLSSKRTFPPTLSCCSPAALANPTSAGLDARNTDYLRYAAEGAHDVRQMQAVRDLQGEVHAGIRAAVFRID